MASCTCIAATMSAGADSQSRVESWTSVNRNVTVPDGGFHGHSGTVTRVQMFEPRSLTGHVGAEFRFGVDDQFAADVHRDGVDGAGEPEGAGVVVADRRDRRWHHK